MTTDATLRELAAATADAVAGVLRRLPADAVEIGEAEIVPEGIPPLDGMVVPAVSAHAVFKDGAGGGNVFVTTMAGARRLAAAMRGGEAGSGGVGLDEGERTAVAEAMSRMMDAAAAATGRVLGQDVGMSRPEVRELESVADAASLGEGAQYVTGVDLTIDGEPARLVQLVPKAFVAKVTGALEDPAAAEVGPGGEDALFAAAGPRDILRGVQLRVCAEIGRATMPLAQAVSLPGGGLVELDRGADEPVDVLVNGRRFATGRLVLVGGEWAVRIEQVLLGEGDLAAAPAA